MKNLIKNEICRSVNSARIYCSKKTVKNYSYCSCTVHKQCRLLGKRREKKKKKATNLKRSKHNVDPNSAINSILP